uniref:pentatricopeptide repeat-containing protein At2g38420, mitochondrial n=1 Tax=Erigeron canadensis TaxID=72917 RepID=UPI001CB8C2E3|nr:pentatricopeptide repeat-containing protein At2g38420, mitochondrial [Erigeron canadensis]XP_043621134.1 pentatricopeptide repeat-containing protein At2g38420, mitochondrial [Erigeron canadensis]
MLKSYFKTPAHYATKPPKFITTFFFRTLSSSPPRSKYHNYYLRNRRKWPHPIYKSRWHQKLSQQHSMQSLKHQISSSQSTPLNSLINSFSLYNCDPTPNSYHFILKTLFKTPNSHHQIQSILTHLEKVANFETPESIFVDLIEFYGNNGMFQECVDVFFRMPRFRCIPSVVSFNCLLSVLCKRKEGLVVVPQVLVKSRSMNVRVEASSFGVLVKGLCRFKKPKMAIGLFYHMVENGIEVDQASFSLVLLSLCREKDLECDEVMGLVDEMKGLGFRLGERDWGNVIRFLVKRGKGMEAFEALREMKFDGFKGDVICYTMVLEGVMCAGEYECGEQLFDEMVVLGLVPDLYTYNVYLNGLCKQKKFGDAIKMLSCMEEIGCKPNMITYNILLRGMFESGELGMAREFLKCVRAKGVRLNSQTYEIIICRMVYTGCISEALDLLDEMVENRLVPQSSTFDEILCRLCKDGFVSKSLNLLNEMLGKNVLPGCRSWEALIVGLQIDHILKRNTIGGKPVDDSVSNGTTEEAVLGI